MARVSEVAQPRKYQEQVEVMQLVYRLLVARVRMSNCFRGPDFDESILSRPSLLGLRPALVGWRPSCEFECSTWRVQLVPTWNQTKEQDTSVADVGLPFHSNSRKGSGPLKPHTKNHNHI